MRKAVFEVAMVVLIRFRVNDYGMREARRLNQFHVSFQRVGGRLIGRTRSIRHALRIKEVNVAFDYDRRDGREQPAGGA